MEKELRGRIISVPIDAGDVVTTDENGHALSENDERKTCVYNKDKGVFRLLGWTSKMNGIVRIKNLTTGELLTHAPMSELKKLVFQYASPEAKRPQSEVSSALGEVSASGINSSETDWLSLPIIKAVDYEFLYRDGSIIDSTYFKDQIRCFMKYYEVDNTDEARKQHNDGETQVISASKAIYYAKLAYTPNEEWDNVIAEASKKVRKVLHENTLSEMDTLCNYLKENYYPPNKRTPK